MLPQVQIEPLQVTHLDELASVLRHPLVYAHIEEAVPSIEEFKLGLQRGIAGPGPSRANERWLNFLVRNSSRAIVGRLEATIHHGLAEVAFLFGPQYWGKGFATAGLLWLHEELKRSDGISDFWATTTQANVRSQRLLERCGYRPTKLPGFPLLSHEPGDVVFRKHTAA